MVANKQQTKRNKEGKAGEKGMPHSGQNSSDGFGDACNIYGMPCSSVCRAHPAERLVKLAEGDVGGSSPPTATIMSERGRLLIIHRLL